jgi:predicted NBD/HSP70 family sugar kinase
MNHYLAFDLGGTYLKYGIINEEGVILEKGKVKTPQSGVEELLSTIHSISETFKKKYSIKLIAMSSPGAVDSKTGMIGGESAVDYIHGPNMMELIKKATNLDVYIENDAKCAALAELWLGHAKEYNDVIFVVIGSGIGGAIVKDRKIHYGKHLHGGEFGYMLIKKELGSDRYMNWSETSSTISLIENVARRKNVSVDMLSGEMIFKMASENDIDCIIELNEWYQTLAMGIFNLQYIYDPEVIIIGGGVSEQPNLINEIMKRTTELVSNNGYATVYPVIKRCLFHNDANLIGAVYGAVSSMKVHQV